MNRREAVVLVIRDVLKEYGTQITRVLREHEKATEGTSAAGPANLVALMELFAMKLDALRDDDIVKVIDARMGTGWARSLADALKSQSSEFSNERKP